MTKELKIAYVEYTMKSSEQEESKTEYEISSLKAGRVPYDTITPPGCKLLLKNVPIQMTEEELMELFRPFHPLTCEKPTYAPKLAFMTFETSEQANSARFALDGKVMKQTGKNLVVLISTSTKGSAKAKATETEFSQSTCHANMPYQQNNTSISTASNPVILSQDKSGIVTTGQENEKKEKYQWSRSPRISAVRGEEAASASTTVDKNCTKYFRRNVHEIHRVKVLCNQPEGNQAGDPQYNWVDQVDYENAFPSLSACSDSKYRCEDDQKFRQKMELDQINPEKKLALLISPQNVKSTAKTKEENDSTAVLQIYLKTHVPYQWVLHQICPRAKFETKTNTIIDSNIRCLEIEFDRSIDGFHARERCTALSTDGTIIDMQLKIVSRSARKCLEEIQNKFVLSEFHCGSEKQSSSNYDANANDQKSGVLTEFRRPEGVDETTIKALPTAECDSPKNQNFAHESNLNDEENAKNRLKYSRKVPCDANHLHKIYINRSEMNELFIHTEVLTRNFEKHNYSKENTEFWKKSNQNSIIQGALVRVLLNGKYTLRFILATLVNDQGQVLLYLDGISFPVNAEHISGSNPFETKFVANKESVPETEKDLEIYELAARLQFREGPSSVFSSSIESIDCLQQLLTTDSFAETYWRLKSIRRLFQSILSNPSKNTILHWTKRLSNEARGELQKTMMNIINNKWGIYFCRNSIASNGNGGRGITSYTKNMFEWQSILIKRGCHARSAKEIRKAAEVCDSHLPLFSTFSSASCNTEPDYGKMPSIHEDDIVSLTAAWGIGVQRSVSPSEKRRALLAESRSELPRSTALSQDTPPSLTALLIYKTPHLSM